MIMTLAYTQRRERELAVGRDKARREIVAKLTAKGMKEGHGKFNEVVRKTLRRRGF